jgi:NAD dependent epimerase/dehydratase family enzyme
MKEFSSTIGRVLHRPSIFPVPSFALRLLLGEMSGIVLLGQNAPPRRLIAEGFQFDYEKIEPAIRNLLQ